MSFLSILHSYYSGNSTLTNALPASQVYTGLAPANIVFPFAVIIPISLIPTYTTDTAYYATFGFQISVYDTDPDNVESLCATIAGQFDYKNISANTMSCLRTNGPLLLLDPETVETVWHGLLEYELIENRTLPTT